MKMFIILQGISPSGDWQNAQLAHTQALINAKIEFELNQSRELQDVTTFTFPGSGGEAVVQSIVHYTYFDGDYDPVTGAPTFQTDWQVNGDL